MNQTQKCIGLLYIYSFKALGTYSYWDKKIKIILHNWYQRNNREANNKAAAIVRTLICSHRRLYYRLKSNIFKHHK